MNSTASTPTQPPIEGLLIDSDRLLRMLRIVLAELHQRRLLTPRCTGEPDIMEVLHYWDEVFGWVKQQRSDELVLMTRRTL